MFLLYTSLVVVEVEWDGRIRIVQALASEVTILAGMSLL